MAVGRKCDTAAISLLEHLQWEPWAATKEIKLTLRGGHTRWSQATYRGHIDGRQWQVLESLNHSAPMPRHACEWAFRGFWPQLWATPGPRAFPVDAPGLWIRHNPLHCVLSKCLTHRFQEHNKRAVSSLHVLRWCSDLTGNLKAISEPNPGLLMVGSALLLLDHSATATSAQSQIHVAIPHQLTTQ